MLYVRRGSSVAHELGYYALGQAGVRFFGERGRAERAANKFAVALLMPERDLRRLWEEYGCNVGFRGGYFVRRPRSERAGVEGEVRKVAFKTSVS